MIDTNLVRRSYRVTVMKELFHRLADEGHGTRLGLSQLCPATFGVWSNFNQHAAISLFRAFFG